MNHDLDPSLTLSTSTAPGELPAFIPHTITVCSNMYDVAPTKKMYCGICRHINYIVLVIVFVIAAEGGDDDSRYNGVG